MLRKGFSLIELLVVVAIIGILAAIGSVGYNKYIKVSKQQALYANMKMLVDALEILNTNAKTHSIPTTPGWDYRYDWNVHGFSQLPPNDLIYGCSNTFYWPNPYPPTDTNGNYTSLNNWNMDSCANLLVKLNKIKNPYQEFVNKNDSAEDATTNLVINTGSWSPQDAWNEDWTIFNPNFTADCLKSPADGSLPNYAHFWGHIIWYPYFIDSTHTRHYFWACDDEGNLINNKIFYNE